MSSPFVTRWILLEMLGNMPENPPPILTANLPNPWEIDWYICTANQFDVDYALKATKTVIQVGDELWRVPRSIGPVTIDHDHWAGWHLRVEPSVAEAIALLPTLAQLVKEMHSPTASFGPAEITLLRKKIKDAGL